MKSGTLDLLREQESEATWRLPQASLSLSRDEVHVWRARLDQPQWLDRCFATLSPDERQRAARFRFQKDREPFIIARGVLRTLLGRYLNLRAADLIFSYNGHGKPFLAGAQAGDVRFNISHSHGLGLFAFAHGRDLGIDLEFVRPEAAEAQIAERFFSATEVATLRGLPATQQAEAFFNCWTRKEAYIKARGEGLSLPLDWFDVSLAPGEPAAVLGAQAAASEVSRWSMVELAPGAGFKAALVVEGRDWQLRGWHWRG